MKPITISARTYLESCANAFDRTPGYPLADRILAQVFSTNQKNDSIEVVLHKAALLNTLYRTNIFSIYQMAGHLLKQRLDSSIERGDRQAVALIRLGHGIKKNRKELDFYSFATKYCHWHQPTLFPMYDRYVTVALQRLNRKLQFMATFSNDDLRNYPTFLAAVNECRAQLKLDWGYKRFDQALWISGQIIKGEADRAVVQAAGKLPRGLN
jgi:hypothetical protein